MRVEIEEGECGLWIENGIQTEGECYGAEEDGEKSKGWVV